MIGRHFWQKACLMCALSTMVITHQFGQDLIFSQYYNAPIHINPAFAGLKAYPNFSLNYRSQWPSLASTYETYAFSYDQFFRKANSSIGFTAITDDQGDGILTATNVAGIYAYNLRFRDKWQIKFGLEVGFIQHKLDWDRLVFFDQIDPETGPLDASGNPFPSVEQRPTDLTSGSLDVGIGMLVFNDLYYAGISLGHLNGPYAGFLNTNSGQNAAIPLMLTITAGGQIVLLEDNKGNPSTFISPNVIFANQSGFNQLNIGAFMQINSIFGGIWLRHTIENIDSFIFSAGVNLNNIKIGYSFDLTTSNLGIGTGGSHEIGIQLALPGLEKKVSKYNDCFSLFR